MPPAVRRPGPVLLSPGTRTPGDSGPPPHELADLAELADRALACGGPDGLDVPRALDLARDLGTRLPLPGSGSTQRLWEALATAGAADLQVARAVEPHLDALAILAQAGEQAGDADDGTGPDGARAVWGVYAAEGPGARLESATTPDRTAVLSGTKPWCSLAGDVTHALVTAWGADQKRGLFAVALDHPGVRPGDEDWVARGLRDIRSVSIVLDEVPARAVGGRGWYVGRDGFAWGGIGVAAVWYGGAVGVARRLLHQAAGREPDQLTLAHLGAVDAALAGAREVLAAAAVAIDDGLAAGAAGQRLALRVRQVVADAAEDVLRHADHALGPGPLVREPDHAARVADLRLYLRQHHAERDAAALGRAVLDETTGADVAAVTSW